MILVIQVIQLAKTRLGVTRTQIMSSLLQNSDLKKVGKTTRSVRYDLNQIPCNYAVEVTNSFKGFDLIDREAEE